MKQYTIVTAFFNIQRENWTFFERSVQSYMDRFKRVASLKSPMVIYIEPEYVDFVKNQRKYLAHETLVIPMKIDELDSYQYRGRIQEIMNDPHFKNGLQIPDCPEVCQPLYDVVMWSKVSLVMKTIDMNPFRTSHFVWFDFGAHVHVLQDRMLNRPLLQTVPDKIKMLCRSYPSVKDLDTNQFYKSHTNRLSGAMITGSAEYFRLLNQFFKEEVQECLEKNLVDCDQSLFAVIFLKHPEIFELYYGDWEQLISNYYELKDNVLRLSSMAQDCWKDGNIQGMQAIQKLIQFS